MSRRDRVIRELMREYRNMDNTNPNKSEIKKCLIDEMIMKFPQSGQEGWLEAWIDNEFKCELEEKLEAFVSASFPNDTHLEYHRQKEMITIHLPKISEDGKN